MTYRDFAQNPAASLPFDRFDVLVLHQDRAVVESSDPIEVPAQKAGALGAHGPADAPLPHLVLRNVRGSTVADPRGRDQG